MALGSLDPAHLFWRGVQEVLRQAVQTETDAVTNPGLTDAARHFNAGRLAMARDMEAALTQMVTEARAGE